MPLSNVARCKALRAFMLSCAALPLVLSCPAGLAASAVDLYLPDAPPLSTPGPVGHNGIVGDVVLKAAALAGYDPRLVTLPWSRAQRTVQLGQDLLVIPLSRTPDREDKYTWIAPIMGMDRAFFSLKRRVDSFAEARQAYVRIAVGMGSAQEQKLREEGFTDEQIYPLKIGENPAQMLLLGRVDAWFNGVPETHYIWHEVSSRPLLMSPPLMSSDLYLACSKTCAEPMVQAFRKAIETLRDDGTIEQVIQAYMGPVQPGS